MEHILLEEERPEHVLQLGRGITTLKQQSLVSFLWEYKNLFAFGLEEMPGIAPNVMEQRLNVDPCHRSVI